MTGNTVNQNQTGEDRRFILVAIVIAIIGMGIGIPAAVLNLMIVQGLLLALCGTLILVLSYILWDLLED